MKITILGASTLVLCYCLVFGQAENIPSLQKTSPKTVQQTPGQVLDTTTIRQELQQRQGQIATSQKEGVRQKAETNVESKITSKDWITWGLALLASLVALGIFVYGRIRNKKLVAENTKMQLQIQDEHRLKNELQDRLKNIEEYLRKLELETKFKEEHEAQKQQQIEQTMEERYLEALAAKLFSTQLIGLETTENPRLDLRKTFVHLKLQREDTDKNELKTLGDLVRMGGDKSFTPNAIIDTVFRKYKKHVLLIVGDAGAGKTTLLSYYALICRDTDVYREFGFPKQAVALFLPLRDLDVNKSLAENLAAWVPNNQKNTG